MKGKIALLVIINIFAIGATNADGVENSGVPGRARRQNFVFATASGVGELPFIPSQLNTGSIYTGPAVTNAAYPVHAITSAGYPAPAVSQAVYPAPAVSNAVYHPPAVTAVNTVYPATHHVAVARPAVAIAQAPAFASPAIAAVHVPHYNTESFVYQRGPTYTYTLHQKHPHYYYNPHFGGW